MKPAKAKSLRRVLMVLLFGFLLHGNCFAQFSPGGPFDNTASGTSGDGSEADKAADAGDGPCGPDPCTDPDLPIDTNVFVLVAAGIGYGLKKSWDLKQKLKKEKQLI